MLNNDDIAIKVSNISKSFKLPHEKNTSIKSFVTNPFSKRTFEKQEVLKNINFEIKKGEFFGIVGRNGSGKSTLLKLLAGIYSPDKGHIQINGKLTPFIELGVGFNPELTGRENVYLNGALLGFNRKEMNTLYDEIVEFAELDKFMDQKLKNYSSGMQVRLAFSIAIQAKSEILILDEVLAVGDEAFQQKCISVFEQYKANKQTIVLVTHDMGVVRKYCDRAIHIQNGVIVDEGSPQTIAESYMEANEQTIEAAIIRSNNKKFKQEVSISIDAGKYPISAVSRGADLKIDIDFKKLENIEGLGIAIYSTRGEYVYGMNTFREGIEIKNDSATCVINLNIGGGEYELKVAFFGESENKVIHFVDRGPVFKVTSKNQSWQGITELKYKWEV
jgi:ABC-2 type transport system ATP-binding protein